VSRFKTVRTDEIEALTPGRGQGAAALAQGKARRVGPTADPPLFRRSRGKLFASDTVHVAIKPGSVALLKRV
jgi:hypothetical protein